MRGQCWMPCTSIGWIDKSTLAILLLASKLRALPMRTLEDGRRTQSLSWHEWVWLASRDHEAESFTCGCCASISLYNTVDDTTTLVWVCIYVLNDLQCWSQLFLPPQSFDYYCWHASSTVRAKAGVFGIYKPSYINSLALIKSKYRRLRTITMVLSQMPHYSAMGDIYRESQ